MSLEVENFKYAPRVPIETLTAGFRFGPMRVLYLIMHDKELFYFAENKLKKKIDKAKFSKKHGISRIQLDRDLQYLRENKLLIKLHQHDRDEFINPRYGYMCSEEKRQELIETICLGKGVMIYGYPIEPPDPAPAVETPKYRFEGLKPAEAGDAFHKSFNQLSETI